MNNVIGCSYALEITSDDKVDQCKLSCDEKIGCNAINYLKPGYCELRECPTPVPYPLPYPDSGNKAYYRNEGILNDK